jgi:hypothetical protein
MMLGELREKQLILLSRRVIHPNIHYPFIAYLFHPSYHCSQRDDLTDAILGSKGGEILYYYIVVIAHR